jgi:hypothetical protein
MMGPYRRFVPLAADTASIPATVATTATLSLRHQHRPSQLSQGVGLECENGESSPSVAVVATVAGRPDTSAIFEERAALIEYGAGVPRAWAEGFACLDCASPLVGFSEDRWHRLINDGGCSWIDGATKLRRGRLDRSRCIRSPGRSGTPRRCSAMTIRGTGGGLGYTMSNCPGTAGGPSVCTERQEQ